jgi:hypothetical protein
MRPRSVILFERLYYLSLLVLLVQQAVGYVVARNLIAGMPRDAEMAGMDNLFGGIVAGSMIFGFILAAGVPLLLAWLAARKRIEVAKWLLLVISVLSVLSWVGGLIVLMVVPIEMFEGVGGFSSLQAVSVGIDAVSELLGVVALWYLFRPDATAWFRSPIPPASADVFR